MTLQELFESNQQPEHGPLIGAQLCSSTNKGWKESRVCWPYYATCVFWPCWTTLCTFKAPVCRCLYKFWVKKKKEHLLSHMCRHIESTCSFVPLVSTGKMWLATSLYWKSQLKHPTTNPHTCGVLWWSQANRIFTRKVIAHIDLASTVFCSWPFYPFWGYREGTGAYPSLAWGRAGCTHEGVARSLQSELAPPLVALSAG